MTFLNVLKNLELKKHAVLNLLTIGKIYEKWRRKSTNLFDPNVQERRGTSGSRDRRPVKVWNANRNIKKALVVGTYEEFLRKGNNSIPCFVGIHIIFYK